MLGVRFDGYDVRGQIRWPKAMSSLTPTIFVAKFKTKKNPVKFHRVPINSQKWLIHDNQIWLEVIDCTFGYPIQRYIPDP